MKNTPTCVGIIMDGNRRWAKRRNLLPNKGHSAGYKKLKECISWAKDAGIDTMIAYAFSTENWQRSRTEVSFLVKLFRRMIIEEAQEMKKEGVRFRFIGQIERLPEDLRKGIMKLEEETNNNAEHTLVVAISYGGRAEIVNAVRGAIKSGAVSEEISENDIEKHLWTHDIPKPEMIIRTGGEQRLSNFLIWQSAYSELFFTDTLWPDLTKDEFNRLVSEFAHRKRRYGK